MSRIVVLGWGSLIWDPRELQIVERWRSDGPFLPVEFARISGDGRFTLVLKKDASPVQVLWNTMETGISIGGAIENLQIRERCPSSRPIGFINGEKSNCKIASVEKIIRAWAEAKGFSKVIWTDLGVNFKDKTGMEYSEENAISYLSSLIGETLEKARDYVVKTPEQVNTSLRKLIEQRLKWH